MLLKTHLGRVLGLGSARSGTHHWISQRMTALFSLPCALLLIITGVVFYKRSYQEIIEFVASPLVSLGLILALGSFCWHMRLGLQVVIEDYLHTPFLKIFALIANLFWSILCAALGIYALVRIILASS